MSRVVYSPSLPPPATAAGATSPANGSSYTALFGLASGILGLASSASTAYGQSVQNRADLRQRQRELQYDAAVDLNNAQLAEWQAQDSIARGQLREQRVRLRTAQLKSGQRTALAANNVVLNEGSPLNILTSTDYLGEIDAATTRGEAEREAWALREQASGYRSNSRFLTARADQVGALADEVSPWASAGVSLLAGAPAVAERWQRYREAGGTLPWED